MSFLGAPLTAILTWGAENIATAADTRVIPPGYVTGILNTNSSRGFRCPRPGVIRNFSARHNMAAGNGQQVVYRVRHNGNPTSLLVSLPAQNPGHAFSPDQLVVLEGDVIEVTRSIAVPIGNGGVEAICSAEFLGGQVPAAGVGTF